MTLKSYAVIAVYAHDGEKKVSEDGAVRVSFAFVNAPDEDHAGTMADAMAHAAGAEYLTRHVFEIPAASLASALALTLMHPSDAEAVIDDQPDPFRLHPNAKQTIN